MMTEFTEIPGKLKGDQESVRLGALAELLLSKHISAEILDPVAACLSDPSETVRRLAVEALGRFGAEAIPALTEALSEKQPLIIRMSAASVIARRGGVASPCSDALCKCLENENEELRWSASFALGKIGIAAVPFLLRELKSSDPKVVLAAVNSLEWMGQDARNAIEDIKGLILASPPLVQIACYSALVKISGDPSVGLPQLQTISAEQDPEIRKASIERIGYLGEHAKDAVPLIRSFFSDMSAPVRAAAGLAMARVGDRSPETVEALIVLLNDNEVEVRANGGIALSCMGTRATPALPSLKALQEDKEPRVAAIARAAVERIEKEIASQGSIIANSR